MSWRPAHRFHPSAVRIADRHYSRQKPGTPQFVAPGQCVVLLAESVDAVWVTLWQRPEYVDHAWPGAWVNALFRNESPVLSSRLIREAVAVTRWYWPAVPDLGLITFVDPGAIRSTNPGYCYLQAGFRRLRERTKSGQRVLQLLPADMPEAMQPAGTTMRLVA